MARGLSRVILIGNVGGDPEMRYTPDGKPVTSFSVATSRRYTTSGGRARRKQTGSGLAFGASRRRSAINS